MLISFTCLSIFGALPPPKIDFQLNPADGTSGYRCGTHPNWKGDDAVAVAVLNTLARNTNRLFNQLTLKVAMNT